MLSNNNFLTCDRLEEEEQSRQKLQLEKVSTDAKLKKLEENLAQQDNLSGKVTTIY